jgi:hypothetical protein
MAHENLSRSQRVEMGTERSFGIVFAVVFTIVGAWQLWWRGRVWGWLMIGGAGAFLLAGFLLPWLLAPLNRLWMSLGRVLHRVMNPIVLGVLFYGVVAPTGLLMRALGKQMLAPTYDEAAASYWVRRMPPGPARASFTKQF